MLILKGFAVDWFAVDGVAAGVVEVDGAVGPICDVLRGWRGWGCEWGRGHVGGRCGGR